jgi:DNA polymerase-3 subunit delta'
MLPWQREAWPLYARQLAAGRHPAWLLHGPRGLGKWQLALAVAQARLCLSPNADATACGHCEACQPMRGFNQPDLQCLVPAALRPGLGLPPTLSEQRDDKKAKSEEILVEDMREVVAGFGLTQHGTRGRVCIVYPAEAMNPTTANTLLKTLEEPPAGALFLLVSHDVSALLPTVRSRCLALAAPQAPPQQALQWLESQGLDAAKASRLLSASGGRPLLARALAEQGDTLWQLVHAAAQGQWQRLRGMDWKQQPVQPAIELLQRWLLDVARVKAGAAPRGLPELAAATRAAAARLDWPRLRALEQAFKRTARHADHPVNAGLLMDALLIECEQLTAPHAAPVPAAASQPPR